MRKLAALILLVSGAAMAAEDILVHVQIVDPAETPIKVRVCGSGRIVELGVMASNQYHHFMKQVQEASQSGPVLAQVRGKLDGSTLEKMDILKVETGACNQVGT